VAFADHPLPAVNPAQSSYEVTDRGDGTAYVSLLYAVNDVNGTGVQGALDTYGGQIAGSHVAVNGEAAVLWWEPQDTPSDQTWANGLLIDGEGVGRWVIPAKIKTLLGIA
jgi:hypothetical protein